MDDMDDMDDMDNTYLRSIDDGMARGNLVFRVQTPPPPSISSRQFAPILPAHATVLRYDFCAVFSCFLSQDFLCLIRIHNIEIQIRILAKPVI